MWTEEQRAIYRRDEDRYPSNLTDAEWERLKPLIPEASPGGRPRKTDMRAAMNAIFYLLRSVVRLTEWTRIRVQTPGAIRWPIARHSASLQWDFAAKNRSLDCGHDPLAPRRVPKLFVAVTCRRFAPQPHLNSISHAFGSWTPL